MLTSKQKSVKDYLKVIITKNGVAPSEREISKHFKISASTAHEYLETLKRKGHLLKSPRSARSLQITEPTSRLVQVQIRGTIAAGQLHEAIEVKETIAVPQKKLPFPGECYALRVSGDSMKDENICNGDIVIVKKQLAAKNGDRVVALVDGTEATLKKYYKEKGYIRLQPANKFYEPIIVNKDTPFSIQGIVVDIIKNQTDGSDPTLENEVTSNLIPLPLNKIICGDVITELKKLPDSSIDLIVTSPPYNLKNSTGNGMKDGRGGKWANAALQRGYSNYNDNMPHLEYVQWQRNCLNEMLRLIPEDGAIFYNHKWRVQGGLLQDRQDIVSGFPVRQIIIWKRKGGLNFNAGYFLPTYEVIYLIAKPKFKLSPKANGLGDVWEFTQEMRNDHPAPFPVALIERIISSTKASTVLDPFIGSGTTGVAATHLRRNYIGIDISPEYCKLANERILSARNKSRA